MDAVLFIHGKNGSAAEADRFRPLFPDCAVFGLDYHGTTPWEAGREIHTAVTTLKLRYARVFLIANSIGAFFSLHAELHTLVEKAWFISPVVDMEGLICGMMAAQGVSEAELQARGTISTASGEDLSWDYLDYVRSHPVVWHIPTEVLYGSDDSLVPFASVAAFAEAGNVRLTVMKDGEHWFHTEEQLAFLDDWIRQSADN